MSAEADKRQKPAPLTVNVLGKVSEIPAEDWNRLCGTDYPFLRHEFLLALEESGSTSSDSGWQPCHLAVRRKGKLIAVMPLYLKNHSYGEFVFDWGWASAYQRCRLPYYPKLVTAIPFIPATGPRIGLAKGEVQEKIIPILFEAITKISQQLEASSWHVLFPEDGMAGQLKNTGLMRRSDCQFHWFNRDYGSFDDFLADCNSRKRKNLRRERRRVQEQQLTLRVWPGPEVSPAKWDFFYRCYQVTQVRRSGHGGYLHPDFFQRIAGTMAEHLVLITAEHEGQDIAAALCLRSQDTLYGRYWGALQDFDCLHFETCYYQGIEYCIKEGLQRFDPGAQGEHKIQRGFVPVETHSCHWIAHPDFREAIADFLVRETEHMADYRKAARKRLPFRQGG